MGEKQLVRARFEPEPLGPESSALPLHQTSSTVEKMVAICNYNNNILVFNQAGYDGWIAEYTETPLP